MSAAPHFKSSLTFAKPPRRLINGSWVRVAVLAPALALGKCAERLQAQEAETPAANQVAATPAQRLYIREYRVLGAKELPGIEIEETVYPFLGPGRTVEDVEAARAALEKAYHDKGYQAAAVQVPEQRGRGGIIFLQVSEGRVGQLRVKGSRYFLPSDIKARARSLAEGQAINFNQVTRDIVALNQLGDRQITPSIRAGIIPGTVDVDLQVKDTLPLHGSVELNNRYSAQTEPLRLTASLSYANLWQAGHTIGGTFQISPQDIDQVQTYAGFYIWRFPSVEWLSILIQGNKSDSNVSTLGSLAVVGRGETFGARAVITLPPLKDFYHSLNFGLDYKHTRQLTVLPSEQAAPSPGADETLGGYDARYVPLVAAYSGTWAPQGSVTELNLGLTLGLRGAVGRNNDFSEKIRFGAEENFVALRGDLSHTHDLPKGWEAFAKVQGQLADQPLINTEQFAGGGLGTVRGYLEAEALGDNAIFGTLELRTPSLLGWLPGKGSEMRLYLFGDAGALSLREPLPEQESQFRLASFGIGSRVQLWKYLNGSVDFSIPLTGEGQTKAGEPFLHFRVWADF